MVVLKLWFGVPTKQACESFKLSCNSDRFSLPYFFALLIFFYLVSALFSCDHRISSSFLAGVNATIHLRCIVRGEHVKQSTGHHFIHLQEVVTARALEVNQAAVLLAIVGHHLHEGGARSGATKQGAPRCFILHQPPVKGINATTEITYMMVDIRYGSYCAPCGHKFILKRFPHQRAISIYT